MAVLIAVSLLVLGARLVGEDRRRKKMNNFGFQPFQVYRPP